MSYIPRLKELDEKVRKGLSKKYGSIMRVPHLEKIVLSCAHNPAKEDTKYLDEAIEQISLIAGQKPAFTCARKSVSNFKIKAGQKLGVKVTLRGWRMFEFMDRFISIAIPRMRDFQGLDKKSFDKNGNYNTGISDVTVFPEVKVGKISKPIGLGITFCVKNAQNSDESLEYLQMMGMPFRR